MSQVLRWYRTAAPTVRRTAQVATVSVLGSFPYIAAWSLLEATDFAWPAVVIATGACVAAAAGLVGAGLRLTDVHRPFVAGGYIAVLLAVYGAFFAFAEGTEALAWPAWPAIAAHLGIIYALQQGAARASKPEPARVPAPL